MRITPWRSRSDLEQLKQWLFVEGTVSSKKRAIQRVDAYLTRGPYVPHIIEHTVRMMQCQLNDVEKPEDGQDMEYVKWQYCMVLIRFVNGMLDPVQQGQFAIPLHKLAENIGLPSWFVELRHLSTHERDLPSLEMLRLCCKEALQWVWENYWDNEEWGTEGGNEVEEEDEREGTSRNEADDNEIGLKTCFREYIDIKKSLKENEYLWKRIRVARSTFGEQESDENAEVVEWLQKLRHLWKNTAKPDFVEYIILHCDETLLEICFSALETFDVRCLQWLVENYSRRIRNEQTKIIERFTNHKKLLKFVNKCCSLVDGKKVLSNGPFISVANENSSYLMVHILQELNKIDSTSSNARRKKRSNEIDVAKRVADIEGMGVKSVELELYNIRKRKLEEADSLREDSPVVDILKDLNNLKSQFKKIKHIDSTANWEEAKNWETKPFGCL